MENFLNCNYKYGVIHEYNGINGGLYDAIEYAYMLSNIDSTNLIIINNRTDITSNGVKEVIEKLIEFKYTIKMSDLDIIFYDRYKNKISRNRYESLLFIDSGVVRYIPLYVAKKYCILADYIPFTIPLYYNKVKNMPNVYTFNEMPYFPADINYKFKFAFNIYKQYNKLENNTLISYKGQQAGTLHITKFINNDTKDELYFKWPINNFNQKFNRYEVYSLPDWFDPRPRIYVESIFYGISLDNIVRHIDNENYDGAYYRLKDIKENGIEHRRLNMNDEVIKTMVS